MLYTIVFKKADKSILSFHEGIVTFGGMNPDVDYIVLEYVGDKKEVILNNIAQAIDEAKSQLLGRLHKAATNYQIEQLDALGMSAVIGALVKNPLNEKAIANNEWVQNIWSLYETRRSLILSEDFTVSCDFSECGNLPYRVAEMNSLI